LRRELCFCGDAVGGDAAAGQFHRPRRGDGIAHPLAFLFLGFGIKQFI
jgi:hypothetical protein